MKDNSILPTLKEIFKDPPKEYRGAPFWAWNTDLNKPELLWQIDRLKEMGFGGFFMHSRAGMSTEYLGKDFMALIRSCVDHAKQNDMLAYLYDEDRWPSGFAGGYVTCDKKYRARKICFSLLPPDEIDSRYGDFERDPEFMTAFDIIFDKNDRLASYRRIELTDKAEGEKWYVYIVLDPCCGYYNGYTYLDTMNPEAVDKFISVTYDAYKNAVGDEFGKTVPAIFSDEPNYGHIVMKTHARDGQDMLFPWTDKFAAAFKDKFGYDITDRLPELVWNLPSDEPSAARYGYYLTASELFASSYADRIGKWCEKNGISFTGHVLNEVELNSQVNTIGEAMRNYKEFTVPGIDMLCNMREFTTAKQAQSVVHQQGRRGMMSELYGVTGWEFDFRGHKFQGDWQAALGVTLRVPHLAWVSMRGSAKRDYPASINYQSAWYEKYGYIEDHFARVNTALTRGVPKVNIAVLHPIESAWLAEGVREHNSDEMTALDEQFSSTVQWLLRSQLDFDFVSESLIPSLYDGSKDGFAVGKMNYDAVLIPHITTVRTSTLNALHNFVNKGGKLYVCGDCPKYVDGVSSDKARAVWQAAKHVQFTKSGIAEALEHEREVSVCGSNGGRRNDLIYNMRVDGDSKWLFIAHCDEPTRFDGGDCAYDRLTVSVKGEYAPTLLDTVTGETRELSFEHVNGKTVFYADCYPLDSFLFLLSPTDKKQSGKAVEKTAQASGDKCYLDIPDSVEYTLSEPNAYVLDMCEWSADGKTYYPREEIRRIDLKLRRQFGYPLANGEDVQPWRISQKAPVKKIYLRFTVESEINAECSLCYERLEELYLNGKKLQVKEDGWYVDKDIKTMSLPTLRKGKNELVAVVPINGRISIENMFLTGDFGVRAIGSKAVLTDRNRELVFDSITKQGLPFYGAAVSYKIPIELDKNGDLTITTDYYVGALVSVSLDGKDVGNIVLPPYGLTVKNVAEGKHELTVKLYATRINTFGALHLTAPLMWKGPNMWFTENNLFSYEYKLGDAGLLKKPVISVTETHGNKDNSAK